MYYLRKESYEQVIPEIKKTDGEIIPERKYMTDDRALYKANGMSRFYRESYPIPKQKRLKLYEVKKLSSILNKRNVLHKYCGEWFDIYDENGKVDISNLNFTWEEAQDIMESGGVVQSQVSFTRYEMLENGTMLAEGQVIDEKYIKDEEYIGAWKQVQYLCAATKEDLLNIPDKDIEKELSDAYKKAKFDMEYRKS